MFINHYYCSATRNTDQQRFINIMLDDRLDGRDDETT